MRLVVLCLLTPTLAAAQPLWSAEVRTGYGIAASSSAGQMGVRLAPLTIAATAAVAVRDDPPLSVVGGLFVETIDRTAVGATGGLRLSPDDQLRLAIGGTFVAAPYTLWGPTGSVGMCVRTKPGFSLCGDLELTAYLGGTDLADGHAVTQLQLVLGARFDAP